MVQTASLIYLVFCIFYGFGIVKIKGGAGTYLTIVGAVAAGIYVGFLFSQGILIFANIYYFLDFVIRYLIGILIGALLAYLYNYLSSKKTA